MESIEQTFNGAADFGKKVTCTISRNGDLVHRVYLRVELPDVKVKANSAFRWLNWVGHILVKSVEIEIGGQRIKLVSPEKYHAPAVCRAALEEKHLVVRARRTPIKRPTRREGKATDASGRVSKLRRACNVFKLRETPESRKLLSVANVLKGVVHAIPCMMLKVCITCSQAKSIDAFSKRGDSTRNECKACRCAREKTRRQENLDEYRLKDKRYYEQARETVLLRNMQYRQEHADDIKAQKKQYYADHKEQARDWAQANKERRNQRLRERRRLDRIFAAVNSLRVRLSEVLKSSKETTFRAVVACTKQDLVHWLESQFTSGMEWDNYGDVWQIDHVIPLSFDEAYDMKCCLSNWTNLRPLEKKANLEKSDKILPDDILQHLQQLKTFVANNTRYQAMYESTWWPRLELGYGKNPPDAKDSFKGFLRWTIRSQAPGYSTLGEEWEKVQRLDGDGDSLQIG